MVRALGAMAIVGLARIASADVVGGEPTTFDQASRAFDDARAAFASSGTDCITMCKALQSMSRSAERVCALAPPGDEAAKHKCDDARAKVDEATKKVLAACPACNPNPPGGGVVTAKPAESTTETGAPPPPPAPPREVSEEDLALASAIEVATSKKPRRITLAFSPLSLLLPALLVEGHLEANVGGPIALLVRGGVGSMRATNATSSASSDRASSWRLGGALRVYVGAAFSGAFVALDGNWDRASAPVAWSHFVPGFTFGPAIGWKHVASSGFTVETQVGAAAVAIDRREAIDAVKWKVVPTWNIAVGYTF